MWIEIFAKLTKLRTQWHRDKWNLPCIRHARKFGWDAPEFYSSLSSIVQMDDVIICGHRFTCLYNVHTVYIRVVVRVGWLFLAAKQILFEHPCQKQAYAICIEYACAMYHHALYKYNLNTTQSCVSFSMLYGYMFCLTLCFVFSALL